MAVIRIMNGAGCANGIRKRDIGIRGTTVGRGVEEADATGTTAEIGKADRRPDGRVGAQEVPPDLGWASRVILLDVLSGITYL